MLTCKKSKNTYRWRRTWESPIGQRSLVRLYCSSFSRSVWRVSCSTSSLEKVLVLLTKTQMVGVNSHLHALFCTLAISWSYVFTCLSNLKCWTQYNAWSISTLTLKNLTIHSCLWLWFWWSLLLNCALKLQESYAALPSTTISGSSCATSL